MCTTFCICNANTGKDPGFVDIQSAAIKTEDFESQRQPPDKRFYKAERDWLSGEIGPISEEISFRATVMRQSLIPLQITTTYKISGLAAIPPLHLFPRAL